MKIFLFLLLLLPPSSAFAEVPWAYCDASKHAYQVMKRLVMDCPTSPRRPGEPARLPEINPDPDQCPSREISVIQNRPELDYICAYPTAAESDDPEQRNTNRCINADKKHCMLDAGGVAGPGQHTIPRDAWYEQTGVSKNFPQIRCQCGCFVGETLIAGVTGSERIDELAERSKIMPVGVRLYPLSRTSGNLSQALRAADFTVGPEEKPMIRISTGAGAELTVTELHPILVHRHDEMMMIQAKELELRDVLIDEEGKEDAVSALESVKQDSSANTVYNLDTKSADPEEHVISANGIRVGDLYWQKRLSQESARINNLLTAALQ